MFYSSFLELRKWLSGFFATETSRKSPGDDPKSTSGKPLLNIGEKLPSFCSLNRWLPPPINLSLHFHSPVWQTWEDRGPQVTVLAPEKDQTHMDIHTHSCRWRMEIEERTDSYITYASPLITLSNRLSRGQWATMSLTTQEIMFLYPDKIRG